MKLKSKTGQESISLKLFRKELGKGALSNILGNNIQIVFDI
jgi:hypothetical protein